MKNILVIDDDPASVEVARLTFQMSGYEVVVIPEARGVASQIRKQKPDLILMAVHITGVDGRSICQLLKNSIEYSNVPVILMSGFSISPEDLELCGADDFLPKPFGMNDLLAKSEHLLDMKYDVRNKII